MSGVASRLMRGVSLWFTIASAMAMLPSHATTDAWSLKVVQGRKAQVATETMSIKRAAFSLQLTGTKGWAYAVFAATRCDPIQPLVNAESIGMVIRPSNLAAEGPQPQQNTFLVVNAADGFVADRASAQVWADDASSGMQSFQDVQVRTDVVVMTRNIDHVLLAHGDDQVRTMSLSEFKGGELCLLITGLPPVGYMAHVAPKRVRLLLQ